MLRSARERETPDLKRSIIACSKTGFRKCSRCGRVTETHFGVKGLPYRENQDRASGQHAFFSKKAKFPTAPQLRMYLRADSMDRQPGRPSGRKRRR